jgi:diguanylate cyclase (GGDEF)-like protein
MQTIILLSEEPQAAENVASCIRRDLEVDVEVASSIEHCQELLSRSELEILGIVVGISFCESSYSPLGNLPTIVITNGVPLEPRKMFTAQNVLDYVVDFRGPNIQYITQLLKRIRFSESFKILVVDDEPSSRKLVNKLLSNRGFTIIEAQNGQQAINAIEQDPGIRMLLVDDQMPQMSGLELVRNVRKLRSKNEFAIIGMLSDYSEYQLVMFLRSGANDCLAKPLKLEEFQVRVMQNLQLVEMFTEISELSRRDFLTNLFNRRHFFDVGSKYYESYRRNTMNLVAAMIDIDNFKGINDQFGHHIGDQVLVALSQTLSASLRATDLIARFGGEEFCILSSDLNLDEGITVFERIRQTCSDIRLHTETGEVTFTISIGLTDSMGKTLEDMIKHADELLYHAKNTGKNRLATQID